MTGTLTATGIAAGYSGFDVLRSIDLTVPGSAITAIVGPNGAGKSTLLKALIGLLPRRGSVVFGRTEIPAADTVTAVAQGMALVAEGRQLFPLMTVCENLELGAHAAPRRDRAARLEEVLSIFPRLRERRSQLAGTMSGGEQQMLAIGRALMGRPALLMLDEPSLGLAPRMIDELFRVLDTLRRQELTVLLVEQNVARALALADHAFVLEQGRFVAQGSGADLLGSGQVQSAYLGLH